MISKLIKEKIEEKFGKKIRYPKDCEALASEISFCTKQQVSASTIKRLMGFIKGIQEPRTYTLDLVAEYLGRASFEELVMEFSDREPEEPSIKELTSGNVAKGQKLKLSYEPSKHIVIECIDEGLFEISVCDGRTLKPKDNIRLAAIKHSYPLFISEVVRYGKSMGPMVLAKLSGITSIEILE